MRYTEKQRQEIINEIKNKVIENLEYDGEGEYWTLLFTDGSEVNFRFMAELV